MKVRVIISWIYFLIVSMSNINGQTNSNLVCFNHSLLVLDSLTYKAMANSEFINHFALSYEKNFPGYQGFYLIGSTNYLEFFHPKSMDGEDLENGEIWICLASLKANYLKELSTNKASSITYESDDQYNYFSLITEDSINPITTWEMRQEQYESWTKKVYNDTISFLPVDYNSPQEADSSSHFLMKDVNGIRLSINTSDSLKVMDYLKEIGFDRYHEFNGLIRISTNNQFIELQISKNNKTPTIKRYYFRLNQNVEKSTEVIGNSSIECNGKSAIWIFE